MSHRGKLGRGWALAAGILFSSAAIADEFDGPRWQLSLGLQTLTADDFFFGTGQKVAFNQLDSHSINFAVAYAINERWSVQAGIPYVMAKFSGEQAFFHDPAIITDPSVADEVARTPFIDTGEYQREFQDFQLGVTYHTNWNDFSVNPFVQAVIPSHDYPTFGLAAVGRGQKMFEVGANVGFQPFLSNFYYRVMASHIWVEKVENVNTNHFRFEAEVGYFFTPKFSGSVFVQTKVGKGLDIPVDFPTLNDRNYFYHDQTISHEYELIGLSADYALSSEYGMSVSVMTMFDGRNIYESDHSLNLELTRSF